jgi:hypothetical protein
MFEKAKKTVTAPETQKRNIESAKMAPETQKRNIESAKMFEKAKIKKK